MPVNKVWFHDSKDFMTNTNDKREQENLMRFQFKKNVLQGTDILCFYYINAAED